MNGPERVPIALFFDVYFITLSSTLVEIDNLYQPASGIHLLSTIFYVGHFSKLSEGSRCSALSKG